MYSKNSSTHRPKPFSFFFIFSRRLYYSCF
nr:MAG TPA: hypothetical protein [Caudoviricetes sp.]